MQIKLEMVDEDHTIEVPNDADFLTIFGAITKAMRDECIYEDEIQSISFWCLGSKLRLLRVLNGDPS